MLATTPACAAQATSQAPRNIIAMMVSPSPAKSTSWSAGKGQKRPCSFASRVLQ